ncbi:hypothetical protein AHAS_Ahas09G0133000 [Arachis hypogaea]
MSVKGKNQRRHNANNAMFSCFGTALGFIVGYVSIGVHAPQPPQPPQPPEAPQSPQLPQPHFVVIAEPSSAGKLRRQGGRTAAGGPLRLCSDIVNGEAQLFNGQLASTVSSLQATLSGSINVTNGCCGTGLVGIAETYNSALSIH